MQIFKVISALLDYPQEGLINHSEELCHIVLEEENLTMAARLRMVDFIKKQTAMDLLDWQSDYDALFERGRNLSLLLFEHVHGESRDRGQAMVDLMEQYKQAGLELGAKELPDYIPLFLEFLATQDMENAKAWLMDISHILAVLLTRLEQRNDEYACLFTALLELSQAELNFDELRESVAKEERDDTNEAIDKVWEEESIMFGGDSTNGGCPSSTYRPTDKQSRIDEMPVQIMQPAAAQAR